MDNRTLLALASHIKSNDIALAKVEVGPGEYEVDQKIRIKGKFKVGNSSERTPTSSTPWTTVIALLLKRSGVQKKASKKLLFDTLSEANALPLGVKQALLEETGVSETLEEVMAAYKQLPKIPVIGTLTGKVQLAEIE